MSALNYVGWDIGGAHLKMAAVADNGKVLAVEQLATPLWQGLVYLENSLSDVKKILTTGKLVHAITTTGELADIFQNRADGVNALLDSFAKIYDTKAARVYAGSAGLVSVKEAARQYELVSSANWHASASYIASSQKDGVFIDIGSSTTDIIPFHNGILTNRGYSDQERMRFDELVYTGIVRTPVMAVVDRLPFRGEWQSIAAEHFATMADVYRITGDLTESHDLMPAADGAGKRIFDSVRRLARMLGSDVRESESIEAYQQVANHIAEVHFQKINQAFQRVLSSSHVPSGSRLVGAGAGRFLVARLAKANQIKYVDVEHLLNVEHKKKFKAADCITAVAVAQLRRLAG
jgi:probable H4MPT-linked C1 transfer pathway protein